MNQAPVKKGVDGAILLISYIERITSIKILRQISELACYGDLKASGNNTN